MKLMGSGIKSLLIAVIGIYLGYSVYYLVIQRKILFPDPPTPAWDVAVDYVGLEKIWLETSFGGVETWFMPALNGSGESAPAMIFFHGNGELIDFWPHTFTDVQRLGISVLLVEYPGYGRSEGKPTEKTISEVVLAAYDALVQRADVDPQRVVVYGRSLGGGAAGVLLGQRSVAAVILQSTFTNTARFARQFLLPGFLVMDKFDTLSAVEQYPGLVLIFHSERDDLIPFTHAQQLAEAAANGRLITMDCAHSDCPPDYDQFWAQVEAFLLEHGVLMHD
jgi:fermentation-respiration switch protein FrsA (DUF1100 family)